jgi:hypothetical protein
MFGCTNNNKRDVVPIASAKAKAKILGLTGLCSCSWDQDMECAAQSALNYLPNAVS